MVNYNTVPPASALPAVSPTETAAASLRLYVARSTPNSVRAQHNLAAALERLDQDAAVPELEIIDVFLQPKRAIVDGVVVTPTLIGVAATRRMVLMGDLSDEPQLWRTLQDLFEPEGGPAMKLSAASPVPGPASSA